MLDDGIIFCFRFMGTPVIIIIIIIVSSFCVPARIYIYAGILLIMIYGRKKKNFLANRFQEGKSRTADGPLIIGRDILLYQFALRRNFYYYIISRSSPAVVSCYSVQSVVVEISSFIIGNDRIEYVFHIYIR